MNACLAGFLGFASAFAFGSIGVAADDATVTVSKTVGTMSLKIRPDQVERVKRLCGPHYKKNIQLTSKNELSCNGKIITPHLPSVLTAESVQQIKRSLLVKSTEIDDDDPGCDPDYEACESD